MNLLCYEYARLGGVWREEKLGKKEIVAYGEDTVQLGNEISACVCIAIKELD